MNEEAKQGEPNEQNEKAKHEKTKDTNEEATETQTKNQNILDIDKELPQNEEQPKSLNRNQKGR